MKSSKKIFAMLLALCSITSLLLLSIQAFGETEEIDEVNGQAQAWEYDPKENTLTHGGTVYQEYILPSGFEIFGSRYQYDTNILLDTYGERLASVCQLMPDEKTPEVYRDIAYIYDPYIQDNRVFVTENGKAVLDSFARGEYVSYRFSKSYSYQSEIPEQDWIDISAMTPDLQIDVAKLRSAREYLIYGMDRTGYFGHVIGAIYHTIDGNGFVYVHFDGLDNHYLDADGTLSFRQGEVPAYSISAEKVHDMVNTSTYRSTGHMTKYGFDHGNDLDLEQTPALIIFAIMMSPFLFIAPILLLILGIVLRLVKKVPSRKRWNAPILLSCLWLLCSLVITVLCIVAILI